MPIEIIIPISILCIVFFIGIFSALENEKYGKAAWATSIFTVLFLVGLTIAVYGKEVENVSKGKYYSTQCQLIETNNDNGLFQPNTNKLKCGDVIENVTVSDYKEAVEAYQNSNVQVNTSTPDKENISAIK
ncbi:TPA: hypothetical protein ACPFI9_003940 [Providencia rettgeri]